jgi:SAM-dependent methyltransferase
MTPPGDAVSFHASASFHPDRPAVVLDALSLEFVIWAQRSDARALDIGRGDGIATRALLARGGHVVAVGTDPGELRRLIERVPTEQRRRLEVRLGQLPDIDFKHADFAAIHAARILHLLDPVSRAPSLRKFYRWLYPEGKLFVSMPTPQGLHRTLQTDGQPSSHPRIHPLDESALAWQVRAAGFVVEDSTTYQPPWKGSPECCAVIARCAG